MLAKLVIWVLMVFCVYVHIKYHNNMTCLIAFVPFPSSCHCTKVSYVMLKYILMISKHHYGLANMVLGVPVTVHKNT